MTPSADVLCGGHRAETCALCPFSDGTINGAFYGAGWCNGDCSWDAANNNCVTPSTGGLSLWVNGGAYIETSDFAIAELIVWPRCLTSEEMYSMSAQLMDSLTSTSPPPPPSPPTSPPPPPSPAFERCDIGVWDNHHGHDCDSYVRHGFCCGSGACPHHEWTLGQPFNYPEKHCCACSPQVKTPGVTCDVAEHRRGTAAYVHTASVHETHAASSMACCEACAANPECKSFVFYRPSKSCRLKAIKDTLNCGPLTGDPTDSACLAHGDDRNYDSGSPILLPRPPPLPLPSAPSVTCGPGTVLNEATSQCESQGTEAEVFETWVKAEMAKPPTLHREYYRQRSNPQARDGAVDQSCNSTTWNRNTFTLRDVYRSAEVTNVRHARQAPSFPILEDCLDSC